MYGTHIDDAMPRVRGCVDREDAHRGGRGEGPPRGVPGRHLQRRAWATSRTPRSPPWRSFWTASRREQGLRTDFKGHMTVVPCERGKRVVNDTE